MRHLFAALRLMLAVEGAVLALLLLPVEVGIVVHQAAAGSFALAAETVAIAVGIPAGIDAGTHLYTVAGTVAGIAAEILHASRHSGADDGTHPPASCLRACTVLCSAALGIDSSARARPLA